MASVKDSSQPRKKSWIRVFLPALLVLLWVAVAGVGGPYFGKISEVSTNSSTDFLPQSAESTQVVQQQGDFYDGNTIPAIAVFEAEGELTGEQRAYLDALPGQLKDTGVVEGQTSPVIYSEDGQAAQIVVPLPGDDTPSDAVETISSHLQNTPDGLNAYVTGPAGFAAALGEAFS